MNYLAGFCWGIRQGRRKRVSFQTQANGWSRGHLGCLGLSGFAFCASRALFANFAHGYENQTRERSGKQSECRPAVELRHIAIQEREPDKDKEHVRAEDVQRSFP